MEPLSNQDVKEALQITLSNPERGFDFPIELDEDALDFIATSTNGDLRSAFNSLDLAVLSTPENDEGIRHITLDIMENSLQRSYITMDKDGDGHYDVLSALQKSIRGSDVDASLHYAARLIEAGDLPSLARRLTVIAYEDIGLANPEAQIHTVTALDAAQKIGFPEARILIANVVIDLALSPKSNSAYVAMDKALADLKTSGHLPIPRHLRDGHYSGSKELGNAQDYLYPHNYPGNWVSKTICQKKFVIITISKQKILVNMNGLWLKERKLSTICEKSEILFKKLHFPLDFFEKVVSYKYRNAVVYDFTLKC